MEPCTTTTIRRSDQNLYEIKSSLLRRTVVALVAVAAAVTADSAELGRVTISDPFSPLLHFS